MASKTTATGSVVDVLDRVIGLPKEDTRGTDDNEHRADFIVSEEWRGAKPGYAFRTSEARGTGYHRDGDEAAAGRTSKRARFDPARDTTRVIPPRPARRPPAPSGDELLAAAEAAVAAREETLGGPARLLEPTPRGVRAAAGALERTLRRNQLLRAQHAEDPAQFMTNELALHDEIVGFKAAAADVALYGELAGAGVVGSFLTLLNHENSDVAISTINVLVELLDPELLRAAPDDAAVGAGGGAKGGEAAEGPERAERARRNMGLLARAFVDGGGLDLLTANLGRFDESVAEDAQGVEDALTLAEALLDLDRTGALQGTTGHDRDAAASVVACLLQKTAFLPWLVQRIGKDDDDDATPAAAAAAPVSPAVVRLHASEVLSAILQHEDYATQRCGSRLAALPRYASPFDDLDAKPAAKPDGADEKREKTVDGIEVLLLAVAAFRKADPQIEVECEFLENVFDALAAALLREDNVADFVAAEGLELMLRCVRQRVHAGGGALKVLDFALSGPPSPSGNAEEVRRRACETFIQAGGLKLLLPLYMGRRAAVPCPAACSDGGSRLATRKGRHGKDAQAVLSKRAKRAVHARKKWLLQVELSTINILYALTRHIGKGSEFDAHARLLVKFVEEDCEKCDRTIELCLKYDEQARISEYRYFRSDAAEEAERRGADADLGALDAKLRGGGAACQRAAALLAFACVGSRRCRGHVLEQLKLQGVSMGVIKEGLREFASLLGEGAQKSQIEYYITEL